MSAKDKDLLEASATQPADAAGSAPVLRLLTADDILSADDIPQETVEVPEWGGAVLVRGMTGIDRDGFEEAMTTSRGKDVTVNLRNFRAKLVARSIVDSEGRRLFTDDKVDALGRKSAIALQRVFTVAQRLSGLAPDEVEELTRELGEAQSAASGTD